MLGHLKTILSNSLSDPEVDIEGERVLCAFNATSAPSAFRCGGRGKARNSHHNALLYAHEHRARFCAQKTSVDCHATEQRGDVAPNRPGCEIAIAGERM